MIVEEIRWLFKIVFEIARIQTFGMRDACTNQSGHDRLNYEVVIGHEISINIIIPENS